MEVKDLESKHPAYDLRVEDWQWATAIWDERLSHYETRKAFLRKGESEPQKDFEQRAKIAVFATDVGRVVSRVLGSVFKRSVDREIPPELEEFADRCTLDGLSIGEFARKAVECQLYMRWAVVLLDRKPLPEGVEPRNAADDKALEIDKPYAVLYRPDQVYDWGSDDNGQLNYVKLCTPLIRGGKRIDQYRLVHPDRIEVWEVEDSSAKPVRTAEASPGIQAAGRLPIVVCQFSPIDAMRSRSPIVDSLQAERAALETWSDFVWGLYVAGHPMLKIWTSADLKDIAVDVSKYLHFKPKGQEGQGDEDAGWLEINGKPLELQYKAYCACKEDVWKKAGISPIGQTAAEDGAQEVSGVSVDAQFEKSEGNLLACVAKQAQAFEWDLLTLAALDMGQSPEAVKVVYPQEFDLRTAERWFRYLAEIKVNAPQSPTLYKVTLKKAAAALIGDVDADTQAKIMAELDKQGVPQPPAPDFGFDE